MNQKITVAEIKFSSFLLKSGEEKIFFATFVWVKLLVKNSYVACTDETEISHLSVESDGRNINI